MKGLILSGGHGTRLRPLTFSQQKQLIPVANKPILFYGLEQLEAAGINDVGIVVGPSKDQIIEAVRSRNGSAKVEFIEQEEPLGLAHAVKISEGFLRKEPFVMYLGDNILRDGIAKLAAHFEDSDAASSILLTKVRNPEQFGVARLDEENRVVQVIEKPKSPLSNLALVGVYFFRRSVFDAVKSIRPSWRNELEITDAIQWLIDHGLGVESTIISGWWKDTGKPEDILEANRLVLDDLVGLESEEYRHATIKGRVRLGSGIEISADSVIKGPAVVGDRCRITGAYIGPYTSIGPGCEIRDAHIEDSIIMEGSQISGVASITESLIGRGVNIRQGRERIGARQFILGDYSDLSI